MAYDASGEVRTILGCFEKNRRGDVVRIDKIEKNGSVSLDIRQWYTDDNDEQKPTSKGVRVNAEIGVDFILACAGCLEVTELEDLVEQLKYKIETEEELEDTEDEK